MLFFHLLQDTTRTVQVTFDLLDNVTTDPPRVPSLNDSIAKLQEHVENMTLTVMKLNYGLFLWGYDCCYSCFLLGSFELHNCTVVHL